jgi:hypothetical protein
MCFRCEYTSLLLMAVEPALSIVTVLTELSVLSYLVLGLLSEPTPIFDASFLIMCRPVFRHASVTTTSANLKLSWPFSALGPYPCALCPSYL